MKKFLRIKTWFVRLFSPDKKTLGAIGEDLRKVAVTAIGVGIVGVVSENGIYGHSRGYSVPRYSQSYKGSSQKTESMVTPVFATPILTTSWLA
nr:hypothetical protein [Proteus mirabilis]